MQGLDNHNRRWNKKKNGGEKGLHRSGGG